MGDATIHQAIERALEGLSALAQLGEAVEDEWQHVVDLELAWRQRLEAVAAERGDLPLTDAAAAAVDRAVEEAASIADPHRAIDWLSTLPQVVLLAVEPGA